jgi:hypothetical protein
MSIATETRHNFSVLNDEGRIAHVGYCRTGDDWVWRLIIPDNGEVWDADEPGVLVAKFIGAPPPVGEPWVTHDEDGRGWRVVRAGLADAEAFIDPLSRFPKSDLYRLVPDPVEEPSHD